MQIRLERLKTKAGQKWLAKRLNQPVRIISGGYFWRPNRSGYTGNVFDAGIYTLGDAWNASGHCGKEKRVIYDFCEGVPTQEPEGPAMLMLRAV